ncbi:cysteine desulfurase [Candidatus Bathyarchaeota archaeon]|nr:cysteine desulfurase [Candidatus Bathyarchaeota archaeon]
MNVRELIKAHGDIEREVYLDFENSGPVLPEVIEAMLPYLRERGYGNPTITHKPGWEAYEAIMEASEEIAGYIKASSFEELHFTHSDTEANNIALLGGFSANRKLGRRVVISKIEPLSILFPAQMMRKNGVEVVEVPVNNEGFVLENELLKAVDDETVIVSIGLVNHEIGTIQPIKELVEVVKERNPCTLFHTDASDAYGRIPFDVRELGVDMATLCSYKIQGPRDIGALYVREGVKIDRILEGPLGTESLWPGLENVPGIVGFQMASRLAFENLHEKARRLKGFRDMLITEILEKIPETILNGPRGDRRAPDNVNISFLRCEGEALTIELSLRGVYVSSGSACTRRLLQPSHVLLAIGRKYEEAHGSVLMKLSSKHGFEDIQYVLKVLPQAVGRLRSISPF